MIGMRPTKDPNIFIIYQSPTEVLYKDVTSNRIWEITGTCNCCGECEVGKENPYHVWTPNPVGTAWACYSREEGRLDEPVTPEWTATAKFCVLKGRYIT